MICLKSCTPALILLAEEEAQNIIEVSLYVFNFGYDLTDHFTKNDLEKTKN